MMAMASLSSGPYANINISAYRVLFILLMLVRYRSLNLVDLNRYLYENPMIGRGYNSDTLTKYINTLREVGCQIPRSSNRNDYAYELVSHPFRITLEAQEIVVVRKLLGLLEKQTDEVLYQDFRAFLEDLAWSLEGSTLKNADELVLDSPFEMLQLRKERYNQYRRYCQEAFSLEVTYLEEAEASCLVVEPYDVVERGERLLLMATERNSREPRSLDIDRVLAVRQLPSKNRRPPILHNVVFALYGRLAKGYRLYPDEKVVYRSSQEVHVKSRVVDLEGLMTRLLKYGASCQVLSPDGFRETMRQHIRMLLQTLENPTSKLLQG